jgi:hypothetical protein
VAPNPESKKQKASTSESYIDALENRIKALEETLRQKLEESLSQKLAALHEAKPEDGTILTQSTKPKEKKPAPKRAFSRGMLD